MPAVPTLTFNTPTRLEPTLRDNGFSAHEPPLNRTHKTVMKGGTGGGDGTWWQEFDPNLGWQTEAQLSTQVANSDGQMRHDYNAFGDVVFVYAKWDAGAGASYLTALWKDGTGTYADIETRLDAAPVQFAASSVCNNRWGITAIDNATRDFWVFYVLQDAGAIGDLMGTRWNGTTRTWGAPQNFGRPNGGAGQVAGPIAASWQQLDNSIHLAIGALNTVAFANIDVWHRRYDIATATMEAWTRLTTVAWPNEIMNGPQAGSEIDAVCDTQNKDQFYIVASHWTNSSANWIDCETLFFEKDLSAGSPGTWKAGVRVSNAGNRGAHYPTIYCNTNGDVFVVWSEHDTGGTGFRSVWVKQRAFPLPTWATQKVADSNYETSAGAADPDPEHPGIVRPPRFLPLIYLCVTWGDKVVGGGGHPYVYVSCALVLEEDGGEAGPPFDEGAGGVLVNHQLRRFDIPAGGNWWRGLGKENEP